MLGEAGATMVAVDRPHWIGPFAGQGVPPLSTMTFYQRPTSAYAGDGWEGLCRSLQVGVVFDQDGTARLLDTGAVYGIVAGGLKRVPAAYDAARAAQADAQCAMASPTGTFFSPGPRDDVIAIVTLLRLLSEARAQAGRWPFRMTCRDLFGRDCRATFNPADTASDLLNTGRWGTMMPCRAPPQDEPRGRDTRCVTLERSNGCMSIEVLTVTYEGSGAAALPRRVDYAHDRIVC